MVAFNNIFERILTSQLNTFIIDKLSQFLSAYRRHYSCEATLLRIIEEFRYALDKRELASIIGIDLSKAFDSLPHDLLLAKLKSYGLSGNSCSLIRNYLSDRHQRVKIGDTCSAWSSLSRGIPQGSVFGPLLFNIFFNDLFLIKLDCKISAYANDTQLFCIGKDSASIQQGMNTDLLTVSGWFSFNGLAINIIKCLSMWLGSIVDNPSYYLDSQEISAVSEIKLLGITIDKELKFDSHLASIVRKVSNQLQVIKRHKRLLDTNSKIKLYNAYFLPQLNYCSIVWNFCGQRNSTKLDKLNERSLRFVFNDFNSAYEQLLKQMNQPTLYNRRVHDMLTLVYKSIHDYVPKYISDLFTLRSNSRNLRGYNCLTIPRVNTTRYGLHSFSYNASKRWNSLSDSIRALPTLKAFKSAIADLNFSTDCCSFCN